MSLSTIMNRPQATVNLKTEEQAWVCDKFTPEWAQYEVPGKLARVLSLPTAHWSLCSLLLPSRPRKHWCDCDLINIEGWVVHLSMDGIFFQLTPETISVLTAYVKKNFPGVQLATNEFYIHASIHELDGLDKDWGDGELSCYQILNVKSLMIDFLCEQLHLTKDELF